MNGTDITTAAHAGRVKRAELLSSLGAGVLGAGIALLLPDFLAGYAILILLLGVAAHAVGMAQKHALEQEGRSARIWWVEGLYWFCWLALAALASYIVLGLI
jgi:hypothetical protein